MKIIGQATLVVALIVALFPAIAKAEAPMPKGRCWSRDIAMRPINDPQLRVTIAGKVIAIKRQPTEIGTQLRLKTDDGKELNVTLEPSLYPHVEPKSIRVGDRLEIQGAKITSLKQPTKIIATTVKKGDRIWAVREPNGKPTWAKWCK
jgi:hypothetical protein